MASGIAALIFLFVAIVAAAELQTTLNVLKQGQYTDCAAGGNVTGTMQEIRISNCPASPCVLKKGTTAHIEVDFTVDSAVDTLRTEVYGNVAGADLRFTGVSRDACKTTYEKGTDALACNSTAEGLVPQKTYTYRQELPVKMVYPAIPVGVKWRLRNPTDDVPVFCFLLPTIIAS